MKLKQILKLAVPMALLGLFSCKQEEVKPAKPKGPTAASLQKQVDEMKLDLANLEKQLGVAKEQRAMAAEQLHLEMNSPESLLKTNLAMSNVESSAVAGWLKAAKKIAGSGNIEDTTNYENARQRAQECIDRQEEIDKLYDQVKERSATSGEDMDPLTIQRDMLNQTLQEMREVLKTGT